MLMLTIWLQGIWLHYTAMISDNTALGWHLYDTFQRRNTGARTTLWPII